MHYRAKLSENTVNGAEDAIVSEMIKRLPMEKIYTESPSSWKVVKLMLLRKLDAVPTKGIRSYRAIALTLVMLKWYASCILLLLEKEKEPEKWKKLHIGMMTNVIQKHWEWQEERHPVIKHGTVVRPALYLASLDIKTAFEDLIEEAAKVDLEPKPASLWWTSTYASDEKKDMILGASKGRNKFPVEEEFKILGCLMNRQGKTCDAVEERMQSANKAFWKDIKIYRNKGIAVENKMAKTGGSCVPSLFFWK